MKWESNKELSNEAFRRLTGVQKPTFEKMIGVLREAQRQKTLQGGRPCKLSVEDRLLMSLEYLREYRTYFHIGKHYGLSESTAYKTIGWVEDTLIKSGAFSLPGRKALLKSQMNYEVVLVDATETPIQRPQKNRGAFIQERRSATRLKRSLS
jgi:Helix-turn-helix of DDE superfamily endonuclease